MQSHLSPLPLPSSVSFYLPRPKIEEHITPKLGPEDEQGQGKNPEDVTRKRVQGQHRCRDDVDVKVTMETSVGHLPLDGLEDVLVAAGEEVM